MKHPVLLLALLLLSAMQVRAQRALSGAVRSTDGEALAGVTVTSPGLAGGATTDEAGAYRITVPNTATALRFTYTGHVPQEIPLGPSNLYDVVLQADSRALQELVVVGYGTQQKRDITGNIATIKGDDLPDIPAQSFDQLLQGKAAGVNVSLPNGVLNNPPVFRIRGINSISLSSYPLIVIDGVPSFTGDLSYNNSANNALSSLNPSEIESIDILKDASAAAIYGSRASAGVVLITTKKGKQGKTQVNYDAWVGWSQPARLPDLLNAQQYVEIKNEAAHNAGLPDQFFLDSIDGKLIDTRWLDYGYRTGFSHNHALSFSGGSDRTTFYLSAGYSKQDGMIQKNSFERLSGRFNLDHRVGNRLRFGANMNYSLNTNNAVNTGSLPGAAFSISGLARAVFVQPPNVSPYNADGSYNITDNNGLGEGKNLQPFFFYNPIPERDLDKGLDKAGNLQAALYAQLDLLQGLSLKTQYGLVNIHIEDEFFWTPVHGDGFFYNGFVENDFRENTRWNWQNVLNYDIAFAGRHQIGAVLGNEQQYSTANRWGAYRYDVADPFFTTFEGNYVETDPWFLFEGKNYLLSYFGRLTYEYDRKYFLNANVRQDEYSAFSSGNQKGIFWGLSAGWAVSEEGFWQKTLGNTVNYFKIRGSYGVVGNNGIDDFAALSLFESQGYAGAPTFNFTQAGNPELSWESSKKTDIGVQFGLFNDRIQGEYAWFKNLIDGLLLRTPQPASLGIPDNSIVANVGSMQNTGHELTLSAMLVRKGKFSWNSSVNLTLMQNKVLALADENSDIFGFTSGEHSNIIRVGESIGSVFAVQTMGVNPENGQRIFVTADGTLIQYQHVVPGSGSRWTLVSDGSPTSAIDQIADGRVYGPALPKWYGGWENTFRYGNLDLTVQLNYAGGNYIYNGTQANLRDQRYFNNHTDVLDRWTESNRDGTIPRVVFGDNVSNGYRNPMSANVEKADFLRVRNLTLGYRLPVSLLSRAHISGLRVYANVNNAFLFTAYSGADPEVSSNGNDNLAPGVDRNTAPMSRSYTLGLNLSL